MRHSELSNKDFTPMRIDTDRNMTPIKVLAVRSQDSQVIAVRAAAMFASNR